MTRAVSLTIRIRIGDDGGPAVTIRGREAWALLALVAAGERGCTPIDTPGPRRSGYVHDLRKLGSSLKRFASGTAVPLPASTPAMYFVRGLPFSTRCGNRHDAIS
jgi:hypothetical protein